MAANAASDVVVRSVGPHRSARVRYEDFATNPHQVLQRVAELAGCGTVDAPVRGNTIDLKTNHTVGGNPGRMGSGRTEIRLDNEWKTGLTRADVIRVTSWCLPLLAAYGYPIRP
jgi:hypothetical protein